MLGWDKTLNDIQLSANETSSPVRTKMSPFFFSTPTHSSSNQTPKNNFKSSSKEQLLFLTVWVSMCPLWIDNWQSCDVHWQLNCFWDLWREQLACMFRVQETHMWRELTTGSHRCKLQVQETHPLHVLMKSATGASFKSKKHTRHVSSLYHCICVYECSA